MEHKSPLARTLLFVTIVVLASTTAVYLVQIAGVSQVNYFLQIQLGLWTTLISPPFYGIYARRVATWKANPFDGRFSFRLLH